MTIANEVKKVLNVPKINGLICEKLLVSTGGPGTRIPNNREDKTKSVDTKYPMVPVNQDTFVHSIYNYY